MGKFIDMAGKAYGELTIISCAGRDKRGQMLWKYHCSCGNMSVANGYDIRSGHTKTCGHCYKNQYTYLEDYELTTVSLPSGETFIVDNCEEERVKEFTWHIGGNGYIVTNQNGKRIFLHKFILDVPNHVMVDHIDRNKMNNTESNLRIATKSLNAANSGLRCDNINTRHKNIKFDKRYKHFDVRITKDGITHYFGSHKELYDAVQTANEKRAELFGEFAFYDGYICPLTNEFRNGGLII